MPMMIRTGTTSDPAPALAPAPALRSANANRLRQELMPAQLVWMCHAIQNPPLATPSVLSVARVRLTTLIATSTFIDVFYLSDVIDALFMFIRRAPPPDPLPHFALPSHDFGSCPSPTEAEALLTSMAHAVERVRPSKSAGEAAGSDDAYDALSYAVHLARCHTIATRFKLGPAPPDVLDFGATPLEKRAEALLLRILTNFAPQCQFKSSGDAYLHSVIRLRLPAWPVSALPIGATPFPAAARLLAGGTNDVVRPLIDNGVDPFLKLIVDAAEQPEDLDQPINFKKTAEAFAVAACLVGELCGVNALLVNDLIAHAPPASSARPFVNGDFEGLPQYCYGIVHANNVYVASRPMQALAAWLAQTPPASMEHRLWQVISAPEGADLPANPFTKYTIA